MAYTLSLGFVVPHALEGLQDQNSQILRRCTLWELQAGGSRGGQNLDSGPRFQVADVRTSGSGSTSDWGLRELLL